MYTPPQFNSTDRATAAELMRAHPFATLISNDDDGLPYITHLPLVLDDRGEDGFALLGHCATTHGGRELFGAACVLVAFGLP